MSNVVLTKLMSMIVKIEEALLEGMTDEQRFTKWTVVGFNCDILLERALPSPDERYEIAEMIIAAMIPLYMLMLPLNVVAYLNMLVGRQGMEKLLKSHPKWVIHNAVETGKYGPGYIVIESGFYEENKDKHMTDAVKMLEQAAEATQTACPTEQKLQVA